MSFPMPPNAANAKPTSAELDVLRALWETGPATVKQVHSTMAAQRDDLTYALSLIHISEPTRQA